VKSHVRIYRAIFIALALLAWNSPSRAEYPDHPVRIVLAFQAGSYFDLVARVLAENLSAKFGVRFIVENRPGANGIVGSQYVARSAADGYTLLFVSIASHGTNPAIYKDLPYDAEKDFAPLSLIMNLPNVVVVRPKLNVSSLGELIEAAKARPEKINYASAGTGTSVHFSAELFQSLTKTRIYHIPYNGSPAALQSMLSDDNLLSFLLVSQALPYVKNGDLKALAVTSETRSPALPSVPTAAEAGVPGLIITSWGGMVAPVNTSPKIVARLTDALQEIMARPEIRQQFIDNQAEPIGSTPQVFRDFMHSEIQKWKALAVQADIRVQ
jgi:tripartite-type tricarboxylate transporter receptor subunit TctC